MTIRPNSDVLTDKWVATPEGLYWDTVDESYPDDEDFVTTPPLGAGTNAPLILGLDTTITKMGDFYVTLRIKAKLASSGRVGVTLLDSANEPVSDSVWIVLNSTEFINYRVLLSNFGVATRLKLEYDNIGPNTVVEYQYYTSVLYPIVTEDSLDILIPGFPKKADLWENPLDNMSIGTPMLQASTLNETIIYKTYNEPLAVERMGILVPELVNGILNETIVYKTYNELKAAESMSINMPSLLPGTLVVTIVYITYNEPLAVEPMSISIPTLLTGTLV